MTATAEWKLARELQGEHMQRFIREGDMATGWQGDPWLSLYLNKLLDRWEVIDEKPGSPTRGKVIASADATKMPDIRQLTVKLRDMDVRNPLHETMEDIVAHNERIHAENDARAVEAMSEKLEKVYHALGRDIGHLY